MASTSRAAQALRLPLKRENIAIQEMANNTSDLRSYIENIARNEGEQAWRRANSHQLEQKKLLYQPSADLKLYQAPKSLKALPMERFMTPSLEDAQPWLSQNMLQEVGVKSGSQLDIQKRVEAVKEILKEL